MPRMSLLISGQQGRSEYSAQLFDGKPEATTVVEATDLPALPWERIISLLEQLNCVQRNKPERVVGQLGDTIGAWLFESCSGSTDRRRRKLNQVGTAVAKRLETLGADRRLLLQIYLATELLERWEWKQGYVPLEALAASSKFRLRVVRGAMHPEDAAPVLNQVMVHGRLRVLLAYCNPATGSAGYQQLPHLCKGFYSLVQALRPLGDDHMLVHEVLWQATRQQMTEALRTFNPHVFVFCGHGVEASLVAVDEQEQPVEWAYDELIQCVRRIERPELRLVVLVACHGGVVAREMLKHGLPAVLAMSSHFPEEAVGHFSTAFFGSLAGYGSLEVAHGCAFDAVKSCRTPCAAIMPQLWLR